MNQKPPRDLTDILVVAGSLLIGSAGVLYLAGGLASLLTNGSWVRSRWIDGLKVLSQPGNPAAAFGLSAAQLGVVTYWVIVAVLVSLPFGLALVVARFWDGRRSTVANRARGLARRPGLASKADVEA